MHRARIVAIAGAVVAGVTGCGSAGVHIAAQDSRLAIPADKPPSRATWPTYPQLSQHSCWGRHVTAGTVPRTERVAPSYAPPRQRHHLRPAEIAQRFLARLGDRRYIRSITFGPAPSANRHALWGDSHPPADALSANIDDPLAQVAVGKVAGPPHPTTAQTLAIGVAEWEEELVFGALRDDFCSAGGAPLVMSNSEGGIAEETLALEQRFPNPKPAAFRRRAALVGRRFGFSVVSLRLLRPEQIAPLLIVETNRDRESFARDVPTILELLNPISRSGNGIAETFEGFFFAVEDSRGVFVYTQSVSRGLEEGGQWAASENLYPFAHG